MELIWVLRDREIPVNLTENSFRRIMNMLNDSADSTFLQINDPRFNDGGLICMKKSEILGWRCPETAFLRYLEAEEGQ